MASWELKGLEIFGFFSVFGFTDENVFLGFEPKAWLIEESRDLHFKILFFNGTP